MPRVPTVPQGLLRRLCLGQLHHFQPARDADGNLTVTPELGQGQLLAAAAADERRGASMLQTPAGRPGDALQCALCLRLPSAK